MYGLFHRAGKAAVALPHVHFQPWVGSGYERGIAGLKVLVLGESHYCARLEDDVPEVTVNVIRDLLDPESEFEAYKNTYTKFERALAGAQGEDLLLPDGDCQETWSYTLRDGYPVCLLPITHPSAGFTPSYWHKAIMSFLLSDCSVK